MVLEFSGRSIEALSEANQNWNHSSLLFESADCSGTAYITNPARTPDQDGRHYALLADGRVFRTTGAPAQSVTANSRSDFNGTAIVCTDPGDLPLPNNVEVTLVGTLPFVFPLHLRPAASFAPAVPLLGLVLGALCFLAIAYWSFTRSKRE